MKDNKKTSRFFDIKPRSFVKFSSSVVERIFTEFSFRTLHKKSSSNLIYKTIVNTAFGADIILSKHISQNVEFSVNMKYRDLLPDIEKLCSEQMRQKDDIVNKKSQICCEVEDDCETMEEVHSRLGL
jgi:hypothetical protein